MCLSSPSISLLLISPFPLYQLLMSCVCHAHHSHHFSSAHPQSGDYGDDEQEEDSPEDETSQTTLSSMPQTQDDSTTESLDNPLFHVQPQFLAPSTNIHYTKGPLTLSVEQAMLTGLISNRHTYTRIQTALAEYTSLELTSLVTANEHKISTFSLPPPQATASYDSFVIQNSISTAHLHITALDSLIKFQAASLMSDSLSLETMITGRYHTFHHPQLS